MISLTRLNGERIAINSDLIERAEETPDTVLTLTNGTKYVVAETLDELIDKVQVQRATILAMSAHVPTVARAHGGTPLRLVVPESDRDPGSGEPVPGDVHAGDDRSGDDHGRRPR